MPVPFSQFVQTLHSTLGAADTTSSLVVRAQGTVARSSDSGLSGAIEGMSAQLTSEIRDARGILSQDIRTVNGMVQQVLDNQVVLREETQQILDGVENLTKLMGEHIQTANSYFRCLMGRDFKSACYTLQSSLTGNGVEPPLDDIRLRAKVLEELLMSVRQQTVGSPSLKISSSEFAKQFLSHYPDNAGFIAERMQLLLGDIIPAKFLALPPIKFYALIIELYLGTLKKYPEIMGKDKGAVVCEEIKRVLTTYLEFIQFLKEKKYICRALFDQYAYYQRKDEKQNQPVMAEIQELLKNIVPLVENENLKGLLPIIDAKTEQSAGKKLGNIDMWEELPRTLPESERIRKVSLMLAQDNPLKGSQTRFMLLSEAAEYKTIPSQINWASYAAPNGESTSQWGSSYFPQRPKSPVFVTTPMLLLLLASGYADVNFFRNSTLKKHVGLLLANCPSNTYSRTIGGDYYEIRFDNTGWVRGSSSPKPSSQGYGCSTVYYDGRDFYVNNDRIRRANDSREEYLFKGNPSVFGGHRADIFQFHAQLPDNAHSPEDVAVFKSVETGLLKLSLLQHAYTYYSLVSIGKVHEAILLANKTPVNHVCLLFIVATLGRFDIFETYLAQHALPPRFNVDICIEGCTLSPLSIATKLKHMDVVDSLSKIKAGIMPLPSHASDFELACQDMLKNVMESKTILEHAVPSARQPQLLQEPDSLIEVTDDEQEKELESTTKAKFDEQQMHGGRHHFWKKSTERKFAKTGYKVIDEAEFKDDTQRDDFLRILIKKNFDAKRLPKEQQILVQLPTIAQ